MQEGVLRSNQTDEDIAEFVINSGYPDNTWPLVCVLVGSRGYGLHTEASDRDYVGIHLMDTWECLEHPKYRRSPLVVRRQFNSSLEEMEPGTKGGSISLDSFEAWKFIELMIKGAPVVYELLHMPYIHQDPSVGELLTICRSGLSNKVGKAVKGMAFHDWRKRKKDRKKTVTTYYRLLQTIFYLREEEFEWRADSLIEYARPSGIITFGQSLFATYKDPIIRVSQLTDKEVNLAEKEVDRLIEEVDRAMMITKFPDQYPDKVLDKVLAIVKNTRSGLI